MEISYVVKFSPETKQDYSYDLMIVTEREKFIVPIRAIGYKSMIDFPDFLDFGLVPVKHVAEKPVMIRNIGEKTTKWHIKVPEEFEVRLSLYSTIWLSKYFIILVVRFSKAQLFELCSISVPIG